jgi:hypothetical protein
MQDLIAALSDLRPHVLEGDGDAIALEGLNPACSMQIDRVDQRSIDVKDHSFDQLRLLYGRAGVLITRV